jgi:uncharacterized protein with HEPN domain
MKEFLNGSSILNFLLKKLILFFNLKKKIFFKYRANIMLKRAVERNLEIIGEAVNRIVTRDSLYIDKITNAKAIIGLRNQVIHAYDSISDTIRLSV